ncbi:uncharacterized protein M6B38_105405 [Iris pallida]|uniref:DUF8040 domain-containing protein n=1 Tax=Iris pallida TaxID=29817 RepID=A0AAX6ERF5_IRIPA|nr:uncharacterized protein M6B38_105405 [Iris pallida]
MRSLYDTRSVCVEEQLSIFLYILGHKTKKRYAALNSFDPLSTVSRYFNKVLGEICSIQVYYSGTAHAAVSTGPMMPIGCCFCVTSIPCSFDVFAFVNFLLF